VYKLYFILSIILILSLPLDMFAQGSSDGFPEESLRIAVLPFEKAEDLDVSYAYLSSFIQNSFSAGLDDIKGIAVLPVSLVNEVSEKLDLNRSNFNYFSLTLRFGFEIGANLILSGKYEVIEETEEIIMNIVLYSIPQKEIIYEHTSKGDVSTAVLEVIDELSIGTLTEVTKQKDEIEKIESKNPIYKTEPDIKEIRCEHTMVSWETNKETISTLYVSKEKNFDIKDTNNIYYDNSEDAISHKAYVPTGDIINMKTIIFKSADYDTARNTIISKEKRYSNKEFKDMYLDVYQKTKEDLYSELNELITKQDYFETIPKSQEIYDTISNFNKYIEQTKDLEKAEKVVEDCKMTGEAWEIILTGLGYVDDGNYHQAWEVFSKSKDYIIEKDITDYIPLTLVENHIRRAKHAKEVEELIAEADRLLELKEYYQAKLTYEKVLKIVQKQDIGDIIPVAFVEGKISYVDDILPYFYLSTGFGSGKGFGTYSEYIYASIIPSWNLGFTIRSSELISWGIDLNLFYGGLFIKFSPINNFWRVAFSSELYLKTTAIFGYTKNTEYTPGLNLAVGYIHGLRYLRVFGEFSSYFLYSSKYEDVNPFLFLIDLKFGIIFDF
jgi:disulfide oxidoreductase YuzD